jgi:GH24 family phage-related lysozyme (muramidase)
MPIPPQAINLIKTFEGYHKALPNGDAEAYPDPIYGWKVPTIGYGTIRYSDTQPVKQGDKITVAQAEQYLLNEVVGKCKAKLEEIPTWNDMNDNQRSALYSFAYNLGASFYKGKNFQSITKVCDSPTRWGDVQWVTAQFVKYCNPGTAAEKGLKRRRAAEAALFCTPLTA